MRIAIIGGGISGLVAGYRLHREHDVTLFESNHRVGGHTNTIDCTVDGQAYAIDTGFIVYNERTYPNFIRLLDELLVATQPTQMSFSVSCQRTGLEYNGTNFDGLFAQRRNLLNPRFLRMLWDFRRFSKLAREHVKDGDGQETVARFLERHQFSNAFIEHYFLPMGAAIWSASFETFNRFPIRFIADFYQNHGLLDVANRPQWRVICGGSRAYIEPLTRAWADRIRTASPVTTVTRSSDCVLVSVEGQAPTKFDEVIFACHSDQALRILGDHATATEREILSAFPYQPNVATLHTDESVLPNNRRAWACWNYHCPAGDAAAATVTYNMNQLQSIEADTTFCVTLNDGLNEAARIDPAKVIGTFQYDHPTFSNNRGSMQARHEELIRSNRTSFCGAYWRNGFHEDGVVSALRVVDRLVSSQENPLVIKAAGA